MAIDVEAVALLVGDPTNIYISDAQINTLAGLYGDNTFAVAAAAARVIAATFAGSVNKRAGDVSIDASDKYKHYIDLAQKLERQAALSGLGAASVYAGGISQSDKEMREANTDRAKPSFTRELMDAPGDE